MPLKNFLIKATFIAMACLILHTAKAQIVATKTANDRLVKTFIHPGMAQTKQDLDFMKTKINSGEKQWKDAFDRLQRSASLQFVPKPFTHIIRGSYGRPAIGGSELTASAQQAYSHALSWYVTGDKKHAQKAIEILNAWSYRLWTFEENDAKLLAAWTGHVFANSAEIIRYSNAGWEEKDIKQFKRMLLTVYYPLIKDFFPEANGNWDAAFIHTMLCIGIFCDNQEIFNKAVNHFLRGEGNGGITKYVYPNGQCQESTRDQSHTQLGLGEFAGACQVAWTQDIDLYSAANNRLALGYEYTAKYMLGEDVPAYGKISSQGRGRFSSVYESVYQHYHFVKGLEMPYTAKAADSTKSRAALDFLTAFRSAKSTLKYANASTKLSTPKPKTGAMDKASASPSNAIVVLPGASIQAAVDANKGSGKWVVLAKGVHILPAPLRLPSGTNLAGHGKETILFLDTKVPPEIGRAAIVNATDSLHNVVLKDFVVEGADSVETTRDPNQDRRKRASQLVEGRAGISFVAQREGQMHNIRIDHVTVRNCTHMGVAIRGALNVVISDCDFSDNGGSVAPGWGLLHNLLMTRVTGGQVTNSRFDTSPWGSGIDVTHSRDIIISGNEVARNSLHGIRVAESENIQLKENLLEGNNGSGIMVDAMLDGNKNISIGGNLSQYNGALGIEIKNPASGKIQNNKLTENGVIQKEPSLIKPPTNKSLAKRID